jgi:hypothetical protein
MESVLKKIRRPIRTREATALLKFCGEPEQPTLPGGTTPGAYHLRWLHMLSVHDAGFALPPALLLSSPAAPALIDVIKDLVRERSTRRRF